MTRQAHLPGHRSFCLFLCRSAGKVLIQPGQQPIGLCISLTGVFGDGIIRRHLPQLLKQGGGGARLQRPVKGRRLMQPGLSGLPPAHTPAAPPQPGPPPLPADVPKPAPRPRPARSKAPPLTKTAATAAGATPSVSSSSIPSFFCYYNRTARQIPWPASFPAFFEQYWKARGVRRGPFPFPFYALFPFFAQCRVMLETMALSSSAV